MSTFQDPERLTLVVGSFRFDALALGPPSGEVVLCLHGFPEFADAWIPTMRLLAEAGYRVVAVDQRGYSSGARPAHASDYALTHLVNDVLGFAEHLGMQQFHLVGHDWGGIVAWTVGAKCPERLLSLSVLSTPHPDALRYAIAKDTDQKFRSWYVALFRLQPPIAEFLLLAGNARALRGGYKRKVPLAQIDENIRRLRKPGVLTAALNWYRALDFKPETGVVPISTLFVWGSADQALGKRAAYETEQFVTGPYQFEILPGASHWLLSEHAPTVAALLVGHLRRRSGIHSPSGPQRNHAEQTNDQH